MLNKSNMPVEIIKMKERLNEMYLNGGYYEIPPEDVLHIIVYLENIALEEINNLRESNDNLQDEVEELESIIELLEK